MELEFEGRQKGMNGEKRIKRENKRKGGRGRHGDNK